MADDTQTTVQLVTSAGVLPFYATRDTLGNYSFQSTPRVRGAQADDGNPLPARTPGAATVASTVLENAHVLLGAAGQLFALQANPISSGFIMLFDATTVPADGPVTPRKVWFFSDTSQGTIDKTFNPPLQMAAGAVVVFSSGANAFTKTTPGTGSAQFSAEVG
jgi:hypothetical protein